MTYGDGCGWRLTRDGYHYGFSKIFRLIMHCLLRFIVKYGEPAKLHNPHMQKSIFVPKRYHITLWKTWGFPNVLQVKTHLVNYSENMTHDKFQLLLHMICGCCDMLYCRNKVGHGWKKNAIIIIWVEIGVKVDSYFI